MPILPCTECHEPVNVSEVTCGTCSRSFLERLRHLNVERCKESFSKSHKEWTPLEWGAAAAGEMGELLNKLKKMRRGEEQTYAALGEEIADVIIYLDLLCDKLGFRETLEEIIRDKFDKTSERVGFDESL